MTALARRAWVLVLGCVGCGEQAPATPPSADATADVAVDGTGGDGDATVADATEVALDDGVDTFVADTALPDGGPYTTIGKPPPRPSTTASGGAKKWFAFDSVKLGLTNRYTGLSKIDAWKDYGYDLDDRTTSAADSATSTNSCKRLSGSPTKVLADGNLGIDNNFGQHVMAVMKSLKADSEDVLDKAVKDGFFTLVLVLQNVGPADNAKVPGALYVAGPFSGPPKFTSADHWPITSDSLVGGVDIGKPRLEFPNGYMAGGLWVSGTLGSEKIDLSLPPFGGTIPLESGVITVRVIDGAYGIIAGGALTSAFVTAMEPWMESIGICPGGATHDIVVETITQSSDLVSGAPLLQDTSVECNALSIGLGFTMKPTGEPTKVVAPLPPPPSGC